jgi:glycosyltransferase involved in cell wall biosynthesis
LKLSVGILTYNSGKKIKKVLESIKNFADEIVVVDSGSRDSTLDILKKYNAKIFKRDFDNFVNQKNFLLSKCNYDWVLFIDDDEVVSKELSKSIENLKSKGTKFSGFYINVMTNYLGKWIKHAWYPDWHLRLAKKEKCRWVGDGVHETLKVDGKVSYLRGNLLHYSYDSVSQHLRKIDLYTTLYAEGTYRRGKRFSAFKLITSPIGSFLRRYLLKRGFLDGFEGFVISVMASYYSFLKYLKLWEIEKRESSRRS